MHRLFVSSCLIAVAAVVTQPDLGAQNGDCEDVSGVWTVEVSLPQGPNNGTMTLEQTDCAVTGLLEGQMKTPISDGVVVGWTATFTTQAVNQGDGGMLTMSWKATVDGDDISGTMSHPLAGSFDFEGARVASGASF